jgi:alpha-1,3-rhamnosyl/mannosyltransferase
MMRLRQRVAGVRYVGYVPQKNLPGLLARATAFVYPSLYEGFGFPVAEAMATGVPVITSAVSSLPEITAGAVLLVDPRSEAELRQAIATILTSPSVRAKLSERGRARARDLSWSECARKSLQLFQSIVG